MNDTEAKRRAEAEACFTGLRDRICAAFEAIEDEYVAATGDGPAGRIERKEWSRPDGSGGGVMARLNGRVFEKAGIMVSTTQGEFSADFRAQMPEAAEDPRYWATSISLICHMRSPKVPAVHMNTRHFRAATNWFGGGADLTPMVPVEADTADFHAAFKSACDRHDPDYYPRFKEWCDRYFFLPHRNEPRGVGGIFFDRHDTGDWDKDFGFTRDVGLAFLDVYPRLVRRRMLEPWTAEDRQHQLVRRGRYVEFNLLYDRGTAFGLKNGGNVEAILMSMPPEVAWP
ncbi:MAG TPA: oxygen-dependent coproporphyrinogen oxidase [Aliidongia sp.]|nr:oxygen-dependent coproporphyrinogen oxidase [Aliidongia sp.]